MVFAESRAADAGDCGTDGMQSWNGASYFITVKIIIELIYEHINIIRPTAAERRAVAPSVSAGENNIKC